MRRLRGHHLFCATLFQGRGYSPAFTREMFAALEDISKGEPLSLCQGGDSLCRACPHRREEGCALGTEDVLRRDQAALSVTGFKAGEAVSPAQAGERLRAVTASQWEAVCGGCRWREEGLCSWELFQRLHRERFQ